MVPDWLLLLMLFVCVTMEVILLFLFHVSNAPWPLTLHLFYFFSLLCPHHRVSQPTNIQQTTMEWNQQHLLVLPDMGLLPGKGINNPLRLGIRPVQLLHLPQHAPGHRRLRHGLLLFKASGHTTQNALQDAPRKILSGRLLQCQCLPFLLCCPSTYRLPNHDSHQVV